VRRKIVAEAYLLRLNKLCPRGQSLSKLTPQPCRVVGSVTESPRRGENHPTPPAPNPSPLFCHECRATSTDNSKPKTHQNKHFPERQEKLVIHVNEVLKRA